MASIEEAENAVLVALRDAVANYTSPGLFDTRIIQNRERLLWHVKNAARRLSVSNYPLCDTTEALIRIDTFERSGDEFSGVFLGAVGQHVQERILAALRDEKSNPLFEYRDLEAIWDAIEEGIAAAADEMHDMSAPAAKSSARHICAEIAKRWPRRAEWLRERFAERSIKSRWEFETRYGGPNRESTKRVLDGKRVRYDTLEKLKQALNHQDFAPLRLSRVQSQDIPHD
ncbi:MAG: hypothetical protein JNL98_00790 [Bryobacterales bacterium]|nr:hypothetical protein [Bryobacterales bacterium]